MSTVPTPQLEVIADYECHTGENPLWHPVERRLYWTDIPNGRLFRYDPATGKHEQFYSGTPVGGFTFQENGGLLLFMRAGAIAEWRDGQIKVLRDEIAEVNDSRFNDVMADTAGRVFCGIMPAGNREGRLYRLDLDGSLHLILDDVGLPNGMGFTPDLKQMYFTDTTKHVIYLFDYDQASGALTNKKVWKNFPDDGTYPDGMTVDADGTIWGAHWDGSALYHYAADGSELGRIDIQAKKVSSVAFGGDDLMDMYITTALHDNGTKAVEGPVAGALLRTRTGARGVQEFYSRIRVP